MQSGSQGEYLVLQALLFVLALPGCLVAQESTNEEPLPYRLVKGQTFESLLYRASDRREEKKHSTDTGIVPPRPVGPPLHSVPERFLLAGGREKPNDAPSESYRLEELVKWESQVKAVQKNRGIHLTYQFETYRFALNDHPSIGNISYQPESSRREDPVHNAFHKLVNASFSLRIRPDGHLKLGESIHTLLSTIRNDLDSSPKSMYLKKQVFRPAYLKKLLSSLWTNRTSGARPGGEDRDTTWRGEAFMGPFPADPEQRIELTNHHRETVQRKNHRYGIYETAARFQSTGEKGNKNDGPAKRHGHLTLDGRTGMPLQGKINVSRTDESPDGNTDVTRRFTLKFRRVLTENPT